MTDHKRAASGHHDAALLHGLLPEFSEAAYAGLGGGIGFMYAVFEYQGHHPMVTIVAQAHPEPIVTTALARAGVGHEIHRTGSAKVAERRLRAVLAEGRPAVCRVSRYALPWRPGFPFPDPLEVAVTGLDGDEVLVRDARAEPERLPLSAFMAAWSALRKGRHHLVEITSPASADPAAFRAAIAGTAAKLTGPVLGTSFDVNFGLSGMNRLAGQLGDTKGKTGWTRRFAEPRAFFSAMTRLHECLEREYTAPGATRPLYADFLDEAGALLGGTACGEAAALYREAGRLWSLIASKAVEPFPAYRRLSEEKHRLLTTEGAAATARLRQIADEDPYEEPPTTADLLTDLAALATDAVQAEKRAADLLTQI